MADALRWLVLLVALAVPTVAVAVPTDQEIEPDEALGGAIATLYEARDLTLEGPCGTALVRFEVPTMWSRARQCYSAPGGPVPSNLSFELVCGPEAKARARVRKLIARTPGRVQVVERTALADGSLTVFRSVDRSAKGAPVERTFVIATRARPAGDAFVLMRAAVPPMQSDACRASLSALGRMFEAAPNGPATSRF